MTANPGGIVLLLASGLWLSFLTNFVTTADVLSDTYRKVMGVNYVLTSPSVDQVPSVVSCAASCSRKQGNCSEFLYDSAQATCTLGVTIYDSGSPLVGNLTLYSSKCTSSPGFDLVTIDNTEYCLYVGEFKATYEEAQNVCLSYDTRLWKCDSELKLNYLRSLNAGQTWVGLDDLGTEGIYVWSDGEVMTVQEMNELFGQFQPDNDGSVEHCCHFEPAYGKSGSTVSGYLNDLTCDAVMDFMCGYATV